VVPSSAIIFDKEGLRVAIVGSDGRVVLKPIKIGRDRGSKVEIASGLAPEDRVIESAPDDIADGDPVSIKETPGPGSAPSSSNAPHSSNKG
jgi:hypothetical protein